MAYNPEPRAVSLPEHLTPAIHYLVLSKLNSKICVGLTVEFRPVLILSKGEKAFRSLERR